MADWTNAGPGGSFLEPDPSASEESAAGLNAGVFSGWQDVEQSFSEPTETPPAISSLPSAEILDGPQLDRRAIDQLARDALAAHLRVSPYLPPSLADFLVDAIAGGFESDASALDTHPARPTTGRRRREQPEVPAGHPLEKLLSSFPAPLEDAAALGSGEFLSLGSSYHQLCRVSDLLRGQLVEIHKIPLRLADEMVRHGQEGAVCHLLMTRHNARELQSLTVSLHGKGAITPTLLLRSLCYGQLGFLEAALAVMGQVPLAQARLVIASGRPEELLRLYEQARLPLGLFRAFRGAIDVIKSRRDAGRGAQLNGPEVGLSELIIARWVKDYEDICPEGLDYVMTQFARYCDSKRGDRKRILVRAS